MSGGDDAAGEAEATARAVQAQAQAKRLARYPGWREAEAHVRVMPPGSFVANDQLERWFGETKGTDGFNFAMLNLRDSLLYKHDMHFTASEHGGLRGYRVATDEEKVNDYVVDLQKRILHVMRRQAHVLSGVNQAQLDPETRQRYEHQVQRSGFQLAFLAKANAGRFDAEAPSAPRRPRALAHTAPPPPRRKG